MLRDPLVPTITFQMLDQVFERGGVADLLDRECIGKLIINGRRQPSNLCVVGSLCLGSRRMAWREQVFDVPRHYFEHGPLLSVPQTSTTGLLRMFSLAGS